MVDKAWPVRAAMVRILFLGKLLVNNVTIFARSSTESSFFTPIATPMTRSARNSTKIRVWKGQKEENI
jgi:hypothetical protein